MCSLLVTRTPYSLESGPLPRSGKGQSTVLTTERRELISVRYILPDITALHNLQEYLANAVPHRRLSALSFFSHDGTLAPFKLQRETNIMGQVRYTLLLVLIKTSTLTSYYLQPTRPSSAEDIDGEAVAYDKAEQQREKRLVRKIDLLLMP